MRFTTPAVAIGFCVLLAARTASAQGAPPVHGLTGLPLPVLAGEKLVRLGDGCHFIADSSASADTDAHYAQAQWLGGCRFGLVHGDGGYIGSDGKAAKRLFRATYGKTDWGFKTDRETFPKIPGRDTEWTIEIHGSVEEAKAAERRGPITLPSLLRARDQSWVTTMAYVRQRSGDADETLWISIFYLSCPLIGTRIDSAPELARLGFSANDTRLLAPFCDAAYKRLKREGGLSDGSWDAEPFANLDYGYYYSVSVERDDAQTRRTGKPDKQRTACAQPNDARSCDPLWRPLVAPFIAIRDAERKREEEREATRTTMIQALELAFAEKRKALATQAATRSSP